MPTVTFGQLSLELALILPFAYWLAARMGIAETIEGRAGLAGLRRSYLFTLAILGIALGALLQPRADEIAGCIRHGEALITCAAIIDNTTRTAPPLAPNSTIKDDSNEMEPDQ